MAIISEILPRIWPGNQWRIDEDDYETLVWDPVNTDPKPTEAEIRSHSGEVDALIADEQQRSRQTQAMNDAPDYLLSIIETLIMGLAEARRVINDMRNTILDTAHTGTFTAWDTTIVSKITALRQKIIDLRNIS